MANTPKVFVLCDNNCKYEGMTKEQILTAIMQAVENGEITDINTGFVSTIKTINNVALKFFVGEKAAYDALKEEEKTGLFAIITNDSTKEDFTKLLEELKTSTEENKAAIDTINKGALSAVEIKPTAETPIKVGDTITIELPYGKTLDNLTGAAIKYSDNGLNGVPVEIGGGKRECKLSGVGTLKEYYQYGQMAAQYGKTYRHYIGLEFEQGENNKVNVKLTLCGYEFTEYRKRSLAYTYGQFILHDEGTKVLQVREATGTDYIKLYFL